MPHSPAGPEPAHHRARPLHWLVTAAAVTAVIAAAGIVQPATGAPATAPPRNTTAAGEEPRTTAPDARAATYPLDCKGSPHTVTESAHGDLDGDGRPETVAAVRCDAGSGTPPHALYVLTRSQAPAAGPRVVATLLDTAQRRTVTDLTVRDGAVAATLLGYSSTEVPRCCPDEKRFAKWHWSGGKFRQELTDSAARSV